MGNEGAAVSIRSHGSDCVIRTSVFGNMIPAILQQ